MPSNVLAQVRARGGRLFILGVGGSAANASHAVNDFRKIAGMECYAPTDNVSELTARTNDEGWAERVRRMAQGQPPERKGRPARPSRSAAATWKKTSARTLSAPCNWPRSAAARSSASSGATAGYTAHRGRRGHRHRHGQPRKHDAARRGVPGGGVAPVRLAPPKLKVAQTKWESTK